MLSLRTALVAFFAFSSISSFATAKECKGKDLPKDGSLRIGVKHRPETCERKTKRGDTLQMHYVGKLYKDCTQFDSSHDRKKPFEFVLGIGQVIKGWDQGLAGMCIGEKRKLTIPSGLGYGDGGAGTIPAGATLVFDVELIDIIEKFTKPRKTVDPADVPEGAVGAGTEF